MTPEQVKKENAKAARLGIVRTTSQSRDELLELVAGLLAHHTSLTALHRSKAHALIDGLNLHGLLMEFGS